MGTARVSDQATCTEASKFTSRCVFSDKKDSQQTFQALMLFRSQKDSRLISMTSIILLLQMIGSLPSFRDSKFEEFRNSNTAKSLPLLSVLLYTVC